MDFADIVETPLLWIAFILFAAAVLSRLCFFVLKIVSTAESGRGGPAYLSAFGRFFAPLHMVFLKNPGYAALRYVFHLCLFIVPIWLSGHIVLWSESRLGWEWRSLPDSWADWMTILVMGIALFFLIRRIAFPAQRSQSSPRDYALIVFTALPFVTGYFLTHGTLDSVRFFSNNMRTIHVLSGEVMIVMAAFLFYKARLNSEKCTACASCTISCPTGTLESSDVGSWRIFTYSHYQCICCGTCVLTCPENAAQLRHEVSLARFFRVVQKYELRRAELKPCAGCGALFVPEPLLAKIGISYKEDYLQFCPNCRKVNVASVYLNLSRLPRGKGSPVSPFRSAPPKAAISGN